MAATAPAASDFLLRLHAGGAAFPPNRKYGPAAAGGIDLPFEGFGGTEQPGGGMGAGGYLWGGEGDGSGQEAAGELIDMSLGAPAAGAATSGELVDVTLDLPDQGASMVTSSFV